MRSTTSVPSAYVQRRSSPSTLAEVTGMEVGDPLRPAGHAPHRVRRSLDLDRPEHSQHG
jgi:hypothetical protein